MKKQKLISLIVMLALVFTTLIPIMTPSVQGAQTIKIQKTVDGDSLLQWCDETGVDISEIIDSMTFELYAVANKGADIEGTPVATGNIGIDGKIAFTSEPLASGWYAVVENLSGTAAMLFNQADPIYVYIDGVAVTANEEQKIDPSTKFTIEQIKGDGLSHYVVAHYQKDGVYTGTVQSKPKLNVENPPNNGGGAFSTSAFTAHGSNGVDFRSFCADIGALGVKNFFYLDTDNHGFTDEQMRITTAAIDYVFSKYGFEKYEGVAIAQIVAWNMILKYGNEHMISDYWIKSETPVLELYKDVWGDMYKIEGKNNSGMGYFWYTTEFRDLVNDMFDNPEKYLDIYEEKLANGADDTYISNIAFLKGDGTVPDYNQQRQLVVMFNDPVSFKNYSNNNRLNLGWMRSTEIEGESFKKAIVANDAWAYQETFNNTPIKYFENTDVQAKANEKAAKGTENTRPVAEQLVGIRHIWDLGDYFPLYKNQNGDVAYDWASWKHWGISGNVVNKGEYSIRRFAAYFAMTQDDIDSASNVLLAPEDELGNQSYLFPINDNAFIFVNGELAFWGGTDVIEGNNQYGALNRTTFMGKKGIKVRNGVNGVLKGVYPHTDGWCIDLEENKAAVNIKSLLKPGFNRIDIIADEYWEGGGMNRLKLFFN